MTILIALHKPSYKTENQQPKQSETVAVAKYFSKTIFNSDC